MSKLAICVPTYNRAEIIDRVITNSIDYLKRYDVPLEVLEKISKEPTD